MVVLLAFVASATVESAQRVPPSAMPVFEYAPLPERIRSVRVGPDRRLWFERWYRHGHTSVDHVKQHIEQAFDRLQPELPGIFPVLFEPTGRIWFAWQPYVPHETSAEADRAPFSLLGYNGETWIEFTPREQSPVFGRLDGHPESAHMGNNFYANGIAFFGSPRGVYTYDGRNWRFSEIGHSESTLPYYAPTFVYDPLSDSVICYFRRSDSRQRIWRWYGNHWSSIEHRYGFESVIPTSRGLWTCTQRQGLRRADEGLQTLITAMSSKLNDDDYWTREQATKDLIQIARGRAKFVERLKQRAYEPEVRERLRIVLDGLQRNLQAADIYEFGEFTVKKVQRAFVDGEGSMCLVTEEITRGRSRLEPGVLIVPEVGLPRYVSLGHRTDSFTSVLIQNQPSTVTPADRHSVWHEGTTERDPPELIDLQTGEVLGVAQGADVKLEAAYGRSAAFFRPRVANSNTGWPLTLYRTDYTHRLPRCRVESVRSGSKSWCLRSDGSLLTDRSDRSDRTLWMFDGERWERLIHVPDTGEYLRSAKPGKRNAVICKFGETYALITDSEYHRAETLAELVEDNLPFIRERFNGHVGRIRSRADWEFDLLATPNQGIWIVDGGLGYVFDGVQWHQLKLDNEQEMRWIQALVPVAGGKRVLICTAAGVYLGRLEAGGPQFQRLPQLEMAPQAASYLSMNADGSVSYTRTGGGPRRSYRVNIHGVHTDEAPFGRLRGVDSDGTAWYDAQPADGKPSWSWVLGVRDGVPKQPVEVPGASVATSAIGTKNGVTYIWSAVGIHVLEPTEAGASMRLIQTMIPLGLAANVSDRQFSPRGFFVGHAQTDLHIITVPPDIVAAPD